MREAYYTYHIRIAGRERVQVEKLDPQKRNMGRPSGEFGYRGELEETIELLVAQSHTGELRQQAMVRALGEALFAALFDSNLRLDFVAMYNQVVHGERKLLRVELDIDEQQLPDVAALPWEFMRVPASANIGSFWLATAPNVIFSRRRAQWFVPQPIQLQPGEKLRIGVAVAEPPDLPQLMHQEEIAVLQQAIATQPDWFELLPVLFDANPITLDGLLAQKPHVLHFIGHGRLHQVGRLVEGQLALVNARVGNANWVDAVFFSELLNTHRPAIVLLQACEGAQMSVAQAFVDVAARVVQQSVPVVVAMQYGVTNETAVQFAARFYEEVAKGQPVDQAAQSGRRLLGLDTQYQQRDFAAPVLFMSVEDGHLFDRPDLAAAPADVVPNRAALPESEPAPETAVPLTAQAPDIPTILATSFNLAEMDALCDGLGIEPDNLKSQLSGKARDLYLSAVRRGQLDRLLALIAQKRSHLLPQLRANLYDLIQHAYLSGIPAAELSKICAELGADCATLRLDAAGLLGYDATTNQHIRRERTRALQDYMVENGRFPELVQAVKKRLPGKDFTIFDY